MVVDKVKIAQQVAGMVVGDASISTRGLSLSDLRELGTMDDVTIRILDGSAQSVRAIITAAVCAGLAMAERAEEA